MFKLKKQTKTYDSENYRPVLHCSICTGEQVAGFKNIHTGKFEEIALIRNSKELDDFYGAVRYQHNNEGILGADKMAAEKSEELYLALKSKGYPDDFCRELTYRQLNTDYTATRMLGYLYRQSEPRIEDVVDEMLAILSDRNHLIKKHEAEQALAAVNEIYRNGLGVEE